MALSERRKDALRERDQFTSQLYDPELWSKGNGFIDYLAQSINLHHCIPQRWARQVLGWDDEQIDSPFNLISLFEVQHVGKMPDHTLVDPSVVFVVHPDNIIAAQKYHKGNDNAFKEMFTLRDRLAAMHMKYWNTDADLEMIKNVRLLTDTALANGWEYPTHKRRKFLGGARELLRA